MPSISVYISAADKDHYMPIWESIEDKPAWIKTHLDNATPQQVVVSPSSANVPRPDFVSVLQWNQHLKDHGFEVPEA